MNEELKLWPGGRKRSMVDRILRWFLMTVTHIICSLLSIGGTYEETPLLWLYCLLLYEKREIILSGSDLMRLALFKKKKLSQNRKSEGYTWLASKKANHHFVNCPMGHLARNCGWLLGAESGPWPTTGTKMGTSMLQLQKRILLTSSKFGRCPWERVAARPNILLSVWRDSERSIQPNPSEL